MTAAQHPSAPYPSAAGSAAEKRPYVSFAKSDWLWALGYMLSLSLIGLRFPLGYLIVPIILVNRYKANMHQFLAMLILFAGGFGLADSSSSYGLRLSYFIVPLGVICMTIIRKPPVLKGVMAAYILFGISMVVFACLSEESMKVQIRALMNYLMFAWFAIPLVLFSGKEFSLREFTRQLVPFVVIMSVFYILDSVVLCGAVLLPTCYTGNDDMTSTFYDLYWRPFSMHPVRKWPVGMLLFSLVLYPVLKFYRLKPWMWLLIVVGFLFTRTFTVIAGLMIAAVLFTGTRRQIILGTISLAVAFPLLYAIDGQLPYTNDVYNTPQSMLRIKSSVDQFAALTDAADEDDYAEFASGRIGQAIPRFEYMHEKHRDLIGMGFLDPNLSYKPKFLIYDEFAENRWDRWKVATRIEITPLQVIITIGYIGFAIFTAFYLFVCWSVRKMRYRMYFYCVMFLYGWYGLTDFTSFYHPEGLVAIGTVYAAVILANRASLPGFAAYYEARRRRQEELMQGKAIATHSEESTE